MLYIGIDSSLSCTAVGVIKRDGKGEAALVSYTKIPSSPDMKYVDRCLCIIEKLKEAIDPYFKNNSRTKTVTDREIFIGIETPNSFRSGDVTRKLCGLYGIILYFIKVAYDIDVVEINTKHAKKVTTGKGNAQKDRIVASINKIFGLKLVFSKTKSKTDDDVADALSIAYCMLMEDSIRNKTTKKKRRKR